MAEKFYSILTNIGKAKVANSIGLGTKINFAKMKVGDGGGSYYEPTESQTDLKHTVWEGNINHVTVDEKNPNWIHIEVMIPSTVGAFTIREYGAYDNEGDLIGICKCAETYKPVIADGSTKELLLDLILCVVNTDTVELKVDPTIIFAKKGEVEQLRTNIEAQLKDIANDSYPIVEATGVNGYTGSTARITKLTKGTRCTLFVGANATGNCSLNLNNYGVKNIKDSFGNIVTNLKANIPYNLCYNNSDFILQGKGGGGNATADKVLSGSTFTNDSGPQTGNMANQGTKTATLNCGGSYIIPAGYHNGNGKVIANSLASQTNATADIEDIKEGKTAWVNGNKLTGTYTDPLKLIAGNTHLLYSDDNQSNTYRTTYDLIKSVICTRAYGIVTVNFTLAPGATNYGKVATAKIYINGVPIGTERSTEGKNEYSENININKGDRIQIYGYTSQNNYSCNITNFRLYCGNVYSVFTKNN